MDEKNRKFQNVVESSNKACQVYGDVLAVAGKAEHICILMSQSSYVHMWQLFLSVDLIISGMNYNSKMEDAYVIWILRLKDTGFWYRPRGGKGHL